MNSEKERCLKIVDEVIDAKIKYREKTIKSKARRNVSLLNDIRNTLKFKINNP